MRTQEFENTIKAMVAKKEEELELVNRKIYYYEHPEECGFGIFKCNSIVINKERMMVIAVGDDRKTCNKFAPIHPTKFSPETAIDIVNNDEWYDGNNERISLEIVGEREYYYLLREYLQNGLEMVKKYLN